MPNKYFDYIKLKNEKESSEEDIYCRDQEARDSAAEANTNALKRPYGRNFILIGDSFGTGYDGNNNTQIVSGGGWFERFKSATSGYCNVYLPVKPVVGGSGFASSAPFLDAVKDAASHVEDYNSITDIVCLGGTNDMTFSSSAIEEKVEEFCSFCKNNFKNAKISIGVLGSHTLEMYYSGVYEGYRSCEKYGAHFIYSTLFLFCNKKFVGSDGTHLTQAGYEYYQPFINEAIISGSCTYSQTLKAFGPYNDNGYRFGISYEVHPNIIYSYVGYSSQSGDPYAISTVSLASPFTTLANRAQTPFTYNEFSAGNVSVLRASNAMIIFDASNENHGDIYYSFYYEYDVGRGTFGFAPLIDYGGFNANSPSILWNPIIQNTVLAL